MPAGAVKAVEIVGNFDGGIEHLAAARGFVVGNRSLEEVPAPESVAVAGRRPFAFARADRGNQRVERVVDAGPEGRIRLVGQDVAGRFDQAQVGAAAALFGAVQQSGKRNRAVVLDPRRPERIRDLDVFIGDREYTIIRPFTPCGYADNAKNEN